MPSSSKKQHNFMEAVANNPKFAKKVGVPKSVGKDFEKADKGMKFKSGGRVKRYEAGGSTYGGGPEGYIESPDTVKYSLDDVLNFFGLGKKEVSEGAKPVAVEPVKANDKPVKVEPVKAAAPDPAPSLVRRPPGPPPEPAPAAAPEPAGRLPETASTAAETAMLRADSDKGASGNPYTSEEGEQDTKREFARYGVSSGSTSNTSRPASSARGSSAAPVKRVVKKEVNKEPVSQGRSAAAYKDYDVKEAVKSAERSQERDRLLKNYDYKRDAVQPDTTLEEAASYLLGGAGALKGAYGVGKAALNKAFGSKAGSSLKSQAINEINAARATAGDARGPVSGAIQPKGTGPSKEAKRMMGEDIAPATIKPTGQGPSQAGKDLMERSGTRQNKVAPEAESAADKAKRLISERRAADKKIADEKAQAEIDRQLEEARRKTQARRKPNTRLELQGRRGSKAEDLNAKPSGPDSKFAKGGKVKAFAKGGFVRKSADGCAQRGKTRGQIR